MPAGAGAGAASPGRKQQAGELNDVLCRSVGRSFYGDANGGTWLRPSPAAAPRRLPIANESPDALVRDALQPTEPMVWLKTPEQGQVQSSTLEATWAAQLVRQLLAEGIAANDIAVVSPFRAQVALLRSSCAAAINGAWQMPAIDTVEVMQGQSKEVCIISFGGSDREYLTLNADFLSAQSLVRSVQPRED